MFYSSFLDAHQKIKATITKRLKNMTKKALTERHG